LVTRTIRATGERLASGNPSAVPALSITAKVGSIDLGTYREVLALGALLLCFLLRKATEPPAPRAQLVKLPPQLIMPDNSIVKVSYHGELANETLFTQPVPPRTPNRLGDTFLIQKLRIAAIDQFTNEHKVPPITLRPDQCVARTVCSDAHRRHRLLLPAPASVKCTFIVFTFAHKIVSLTSQSDAGTKDVQ